MRNILRNNITIKVISIFFALLLWFIVNPVKQITLSIPVNEINEASLRSRNIVLKSSDYTKSIDIKVRGRDEKIKNISVNDFQAVLNFSKIKSSHDNIINIDGPYYLGKEKGISFEVVTQTAINLNLESIENNPFRVDIASTGSLKPNYKIVSMTADPEIMNIEGADSMLRTVGNVSTTVDVSGLDRDTTIKQNYKVFDKDGREITELSNKFSVDIKIEIAKEVPVLPVITGVPAQGFIEETKQIKPEKVLIKGLPDILKNINELKTEPIDINNSNANISTIGKIIIPEGIELVDSPADISVNVAIEPLVSKEFIIEKNDIKVINTEADYNLNYTIETENVKVEISAPQADIANIDLKSLSPFIYITGLNEGANRVVLNFTLPPAAKLAKTYEVDVLLQKN